MEKHLVNDEFLNKEEQFIKKLQQLSEKMESRELSVTANRVSVLNGLYDFTDYNDMIFDNQERIRDIVIKRFDEKAVLACKVAISELFYQRNDCYQALVHIVGVIPVLEQEKEYDVLFAALYIQMCIMIVTGQLKAIYPMIESMGKWLIPSKKELLIDNYEALAAWCAMYDDDWFVIDKWMEEKSPNEYGSIQYKDVFRLFIKARIYLTQEKYVAAIALLEAIRPVLQRESRQMDICELELLMALACYMHEKKEDAYRHISCALEIAKDSHLDRLLADEGEKMYLLLRDYKNELKLKDYYVDDIINLSKQMALLYPHYMKSHKADYPTLTKAELTVLQLMAAERSNSEISSFLGVSINTVKFHSKNLYKKLGVKNRLQAVKLGKEEKYI